MTQFVALERNAEKGIPGHMAEAYRAYRAGRLDEFYAPLVVDDAALARGLERRRARDRHAAPRPAAPRSASAPARSRGVAAVPSATPVEEAALVAAEYSALREADLGPRAAATRIDDLERTDGLAGLRERPRLAVSARLAAARSRSSRRGAPRSSLFALAFVVFWIEALGWPMAKGRDTWDYLAYYLQLFDVGSAALASSSSSGRRSRRSSSGCRSTSAGSGCSRSSSALLYAASILAWSATALTFGRIPALFSAALLLVYPGVRNALPPGVERRGVRERDSPCGPGCSLGAMQTPTAWLIRCSRCGGIAVLVLIRPANQVLLPLAF